MTMISTVTTTNRRSIGIGRIASATRGASRRTLAPPTLLGTALLRPDPDLTAAEALALPDRHDLLQPVDEPVAGLERLRPVSRRHGDADARLPDRDDPRPVQHRDPADRPAPLRLRREAPHLALRHARERL